MDKVVIIGASGHSKVIIDILQLNGFTTVGLIDDVNISSFGQTVMDIPIIGGSDKLNGLLKSGVSNAFVAFGNNKARVEVGERLLLMGFKLLKAIHPRAIIADSSIIGEGTTVIAGAVINSNVKIGKHVIINTGSTIDHDCVISDGVHISPGVNLAGTVKVGEKTHIGVGATVIEKINIASNSIIGAGAVVVRDIEEGVIAYGVPAKTKRKIQ